MELHHCAEKQTTCSLTSPNYLWTGEGWLYLAVVLDLFSRRVGGWSLQARLDRSLVVNALQSALCQRCPGIGVGLLHHSDRGSQYASGDFQALLSEQDRASRTFCAA